MAKAHTLETFVAKAREVHGDRYKYVALEKGPHYKLMVRLVCAEHGEFVMRGNAHLSQGSGCPKCATRLMQAGALRRWASEDRTKVTKQEKKLEIKIQDFEVDFSTRKYRLKDIETKCREVHGDKYTYIKAASTYRGILIDYTCPKHGTQTQILEVHLRSKGCPVCSAESRRYSQRWTVEKYAERANEVHGQYTYKTLDYDNYRKAMVTYICGKHGEHTQDAASHLAGQGCPKCVGRVSKANIEIKDFLEALGLDVKLEYRFQGDLRSFDIAVPSKSLVIEYNGNYWHSSRYIESSDHKSKSALATKNGYRCLHIHSDEWKDRRLAVENLLRAATGGVSSKIFARNTEVVTIDRHTAAEFLEKYHIQGASSVGEYFGLKHNNNLCAVMVFNKNTSSRNQKSSEHCVELTRYATSTAVVGGFTKLLKHYIRNNKEVTSVVSYSDERLFTGDTYKKAGFEKLHTTQPDYRYLEKGLDTLYHKSNYQKSRLIKRFGEEFCRDKTEKEITEAAGLYRVYDCGKTKWFLQVQQR